MPHVDAAAVRAADKVLLRYSPSTQDAAAYEITREYRPLVEAAQKIAWVVEGQGAQSAHLISSEDCSRLRAALREVVGDKP
jgi:hypothetical protein